MRLTDLRVVDFRNLASTHLEPNSRFNIFEGANGQGKTNLLESIYVLAALKSFRASTNAELIRFDQQQADVRGVIEHQQAERVVRVSVGRSRRVWLDGQLSKSLADSLGQLTAVLFAPEDLSITKGSPLGRRRFLDRAAFNRWPTSLGDLKRYEEVLRQRNALLRDEGSDELLDVFDEQLAEFGARVIGWRRSYLSDYVPLFRECLAEVSGGELRGDLAYEGRIEGEGPTGFLEAIRGDRRRDRARRVTSRGPHVDDLLATLNDKPARAFASQGQHRAFVLAMKIAEIRLLDQHLGYSPVLLLDDVSSELDAGRNEQLMSYLTSDAFQGQVFLTTTDRSYVRIDSNHSCFTIRSGVLQESD